MLFSDLARAEPDLAGLRNGQSDFYVWVVAGSGEETGYTGGSGWSYSIWLIRDEPGPARVSGGVMGRYIATKPVVIWPSFWDSLPDYAGGP
jgi:hypothetical protein